MIKFKFKRGDLIEIKNPHNRFVEQDDFPSIGELGFIEGADDWPGGANGWYFVCMSSGKKETLYKTWMKKHV
jgi:hypothetical protein